MAAKKPAKKAAKSDPDEKIRFKIAGDRRIFEAPLNPYKLTFDEQAEAERMCRASFADIDFNSRTYTLFLLKAAVGRVDPLKARDVGSLTDDEVEVLDEERPTSPTSQSGDQT